MNISRNGAVYPSYRVYHLLESEVDLPLNLP